MTDEITKLCDQFVSDVKQRINQLDTQYLSGITKFFVTYLNTIHTTEPATSATPQLGSLLHTHINRKTPKVAGTRNIRVQPTALTRRVSIAKGTKLALCGRPTKKDSTDSSTQTRQGRQEYTKRKQNLIEYNV